jgi:hypothetical protein
MIKSDLVCVRTLLPEDKNFIFATWLRGLYYGDSVYSHMRKQTFMAGYHAVIDHILEKPTTVVKIACLKDDPSVILGYSVLSEAETVLEFVFVKKQWRKIGIAKDLVPSTVRHVTHLTKAGLGIVKQKDWDFNPFLIT